ncbi:MAG: hypothetical protein PHY43_09740 [Verrucomicrobiales bacterium]|nr:hypothetical protein [Verrucomicrobiales bacterium]
MSPLRSPVYVCVSSVGMMSWGVLHLSRQRSGTKAAALSREMRHAEIDDAGACHHAGCAMLMTHTYTGLLRYVRSHWLRLQCSIASRYYQRVTFPVRCWVACGRPPQFRPQLPWWSPFVWHWLHITGWLRASRRRQQP